MAHQKTLIGVDIGGTKIHAGLFNAHDFSMLAERKIVTPAKGSFRSILDEVVSLIHELRDKDTVGAGVGFPGYINGRTGMLYHTPNLPLKEPLNVLDFFRDALDLRVAVDNDAKLFTLAEYELNWKDKIRNMVGLTLGTGLGGGLILDGQLYRGRDGFAGEFGHISVNYNREFEDFVSGKGKVSELGLYLGMLISDVINIFNPEAIILGGSVSKDFEKNQKQVWNEIKNRTVFQASTGLPVEISKLQNPGTLGAAMLAGSFMI